MDIAIIGGGLTGLSAAYEFLKAGHTVTVYERDSVLGGLAHGFRSPDWEWPLEFAYHHFFTNDAALLHLLSELEMTRDIIIKRPITATLLPNSKIENRTSEIDSLPIYQLDSPMSLLQFSPLPVSDRLRTGFLLGMLKVNPLWKPLENFTAQDVFIAVGGKAGWNTIWQPLLYGKFHDFAPTVSAAWLWARIKKRTTNLGYIRGGFQDLVNTLADKIIDLGGTISIDTDVQTITPSGPSKIEVHRSHGQQYTDTTAQRPAHTQGNNSGKTDTTTSFNKVLLTIPSGIAAKLVKFPREYIRGLNSIPHLYAQLIVLETAQPVLPKNIYWLNINDRTYPFLAAVQHTNFIGKEHYANHHLTYFGNYLPEGHPYISLDKNQLLKKFLPYIERLCRKPKVEILNSYLLTAPNAQPVHQKRYSGRAPKLQTPIPNIFLANLDSVVPWDRGTNYAVELGRNAAHQMEKLE